MQIKEQPAPILLFNDECGVCRSIANWVKRQAQSGSGTASIVVQPIGQDPEELRALNQDLNIWDAYATIHLLMLGGSMRLGGEAVAEVLRNFPVPDGSLGPSQSASSGFGHSRRCLTWLMPSWQTCAQCLAVRAAARRVHGCVRSDGWSNGQRHYLVGVITRVQVPISPRCWPGGVPRKRITSELSCST
jgi:hypothetical protein